MNNDLYKKMVGIDPQHEGRSSAIDTDDPNELLARTKRYFEAYLGRQRGEAAGKKEHLIGTAVAVFGVDVDEAREVLQKVLAAKGVVEDKLTKVKIDQPALKDEKPAEDEVATDVNLEPVDFKKDQEDTLTQVTDKDLEKPTQLIDTQQREYMDAMFGRKRTNEVKVDEKKRYKITNPKYEGGGEGFAIKWLDRDSTDTGYTSREEAEKVADRYCKKHPVKADESHVTEGMHELAVELDNISQEEIALITTAIEKGIIRNEIPSYEDMYNTMVDLDAASKLGDEEGHEILRTGMLHTADKTQIAADWIKGVILPFIKGELGDHGVGDLYEPPEPTMHGDKLKVKPADEKPRESVLHICNACCKTFTATEAKCSHCQSEDVEAIVEEQDNETEASRLGYTPEQWALLDHIETSIDSFVTDLDDTYTWDVVQPVSTQDVYEWLEDKRPEVFQSVLRDPDVLSTDAGSEAFFEAMADLGIAVRKPEVDHSREDRAEEDRRDRSFEANEAIELSDEDKQQFRIAADTLLGEPDTGMDKEEARIIVKRFAWSEIVNKVDESITLKELRDLIPELDLPADDKILLNQAFEEGFLKDETPTYTYMLQQLIDTGNAERVGLKDAGQDLKTGKLAGVPEVAEAWLRDIILPKLRHRYGIKVGEEPVDEKNKDKDDDDKPITIPDKPVEEDLDRAHRVDYHDDEVSFDAATQRSKNHIAKRKHGKDYAECDADEKALVDKEFDNPVPRDPSLTHKRAQNPWRLELKNSESKISEPKEMEDALKKGAQEKGFKPGGERYNRYVYGTLAKHEKANEKEIDPEFPEKYKPGDVGHIQRRPFRGKTHQALVRRHHGIPTSDDLEKLKFGSSEDFKEGSVTEFEDDKNAYTSLGRNLEKDEAEEIARRKKGHAVVDDEDETKWMVVQRTDEADEKPASQEHKCNICLKDVNDVGDLNPEDLCRQCAKRQANEADEKPASQEHKCNICLKDVNDVGDLNPEDLCRQCAKRQAKESRQLYTKKEARSEFRRYLP